MNMHAACIMSYARRRRQEVNIISEAIKAPARKYFLEVQHTKLLYWGPFETRAAYSELLYVVKLLSMGA